MTFLLSKPHPGVLCSYCEEPKRPEVLGGVGFAGLEGEESRWVEKTLEDCERALEEMREEHTGWEGPEVRVMALMRDGERV